MKQYLLLFFIFFISTILKSEYSISLEKAIETARENNLSLQSSFYQMESAKWAYQNSRTQFLPKINFTETAVFFDEEIYLDFGFGAFPLQEKQNFISTLQVEQVLFAGGRLFNAHQISRLQYEISQNSYQKMLMDIDSKVTEYYYLLLQTLSTLEILNLHLALCQDLRSNSETLYNNGIGLQTDVLQWDLRIIEIENQRNELSNVLVNIEQLWALVLGINDIYDIPVPEIILIDEILNEIREFSELDNKVKKNKMDEFINKVRENNFDLKNLEKTRETMNYMRKISKAEFLPTVFASLNYELANERKLTLDGDRNWQIMANISIPIFHGFRNVTNYRVSHYQLESQKMNLEEGKRGLEIQARQVWFDFESSVNNVFQYEKHYTLAERSLNIVRTLHEQGMTTNIALTDAQNSTLVSNIQFINSIYDFVNKKNKLINMVGGVE